MGKFKKKVNPRKYYQRAYWRFYKKNPELIGSTCSTEELINKRVDAIIEAKKNNNYAYINIDSLSLRKPDTIKRKIAKEFPGIKVTDHIPTAIYEMFSSDGIFNNDEEFTIMNKFTNHMHKILTYANKRIPKYGIIKSDDQPYAVAKVKPNIIVNLTHIKQPIVDVIAYIFE